MSNFDRKEFGRNIRKFRKAKDLINSYNVIKNNVNELISKEI